ncbi:hypothetical protein PACTADRAFT_20293, partial [Pachysolen tannophilus NRRL Y-2460]
ATSVTTTYDDSTNEGGDQANSENDNDLILTIPELMFKMEDKQSFIIEINDWFVYNDLKKIPAVEAIFNNRANVEHFAKLDQHKQVSIIEDATAEFSRIVSNIVDKNDDYKGLLKILISLSYLSMGGCYSEEVDIQEHEMLIYENLSKLITYDIVDPLLNINKYLLKNILKSDGDIRKLLELTTMFFYSLTILYFLLCFILEEKIFVDLELKEKLIQQIDDSNILIEFVKGINTWRYLNTDLDCYQLKIKQNFKLRNLITCISKLILLEFGGLKDLKKTKDFLRFKYEKDDPQKVNDKSLWQSGKFKVSPLDYYQFREDLATRYPSYTPPPPKNISEEVELTLEDINSNTSINNYGTNNDSDNNSHDNTAQKNEYKDSLPFLTRRLSESLINPPFSQRRANARMSAINIPPPDIHIATPACSPILDFAESPTTNNPFLSFASNAKKSFQTNSNYPYIYPDDETDVPYSIKEAGNIFYNSVKEDVNTAQFMEVFEDFIVQERGVIDTLKEDHNKKRNFEYKKEDIERFPNFEKEIKILMRIEKFYQYCLSDFNSLVFVLLQVIISNTDKEKLTKKPTSQKPNTHLHQQQQQAQKESNKKDFTKEEIFKLASSVYGGEKLPYALKQKCEVSRTKEITLKFASQILFLLLKWFKLSHILKFEYLAMIIFDENYYEIFLNFLSSNFEQVQESLNNFDDFMLDNIDDSEILSKQFNNDELIFLKYQYYSEFGWNKVLKEELDISDFKFFDFCFKNTSNGIRNLDNKAQDLKKFQKQHENLKNEANKHNKLIPSYYNLNNPKLSIYNWNYCFILTNMLNVLYLTMDNNKTQRVNQLVDKKPTELLRLCLQIYNKYYYRPILKIIKLIIPFNGKKWKSNNMDLISLIYLYYKVELKDLWLTNNYNNNNLDTMEELKRSYNQEYSLRSLLQYYNLKNYHSQMKNLGY